MILQITLGFFVILSLALSYAVYNLLLKQEEQIENIGLIYQSIIDNFNYFKDEKKFMKASLMMKFQMVCRLM